MSNTINIDVGGSGAELRQCEATLLSEIADAASKRRDVAQTYAFALRSSERNTIDWKKVNRAIIRRWSAPAYTKRLAWSGKCFRDGASPARRGRVVKRERARL